MGREVSMGGMRRKFSREFKLEAVRMVSEGGHSANQVARDLDIRPDMLRRWRRQFEEDPEQAFPGVGQRRAREEEVWQLRRQLERVTAERDILKKALGIVSDRRR
jgi:transposase